MRLLPAIAVLCALALPAAGAEVGGTAKAGGKPVQSAVIGLDAPGALPFVQTKPVIIGQSNLDFDPRVLAVRVGTKVDFPNNDVVPAPIASASILIECR